MNDWTASSPTQSAQIYSMTGFSRVTGRASDSLGFTLTLKSVNHRYLDLQMRLPPGLDALELRLRRALKAQLVRGHIDLTLTLDRSTRSAAKYNRSLVATYLTAFRAAGEEHGILQEPELNAILRLPGILSEDHSTADDDPAVLEDAVLGQLLPAVAALKQMRAEEGEALVREVQGCLDRIEVAVIETSSLRAGVQGAHFERLTERLFHLLAGAFDADRVLQEAALLAERSDVQEEIARLQTHVTHFRSLLEAGGEIEKKADFLTQELNREANTLLAKTGGVPGSGRRITELGLQIKSDIEKVREQVQNLE
ncbi:MAG TPA: YicC/YloC family endoribonuclease [Acidisarcina sp.]